MKEQQHDNEKYLAVTDSHGWARHEEKSEAIQNALGHSSYISIGDEVKVNVYRCEPDTVMTNFGQIGIWMRQDDNEKADLSEEDITERTHYLRGSDPLVKLERYHFEVVSPESQEADIRTGGLGKGFNRKRVEEIDELLHDEE